MAYNDSGDLQPNSTYALGGYSFELKVQTVHEPGEEDVVSVFAICRSPDGTRETVPMDFPEGATVESWCVEANETEASVYVTIKDESGVNAIRIVCDTPLGQNFRSNDIIGKSPADYYGNTWDCALLKRGSSGITWLTRYNGKVYAANESGNRGLHIAYYVTRFPNEYGVEDVPVWRSGESTTAIAGDGVFDEAGAIYKYCQNVPESTVNPDGKRPHQQIKGGEYLVARFAIDLREADGGPDGDWDEPGDTGDPSYTLNVSVTGASSGSNSGIPLEAQEQSGYGSGGYGGNGGGGGAGASTVIIYEFATDKAGTVNQEATAQGPGTGGPGGKGGKGGDGCILIFY